MASSVLMDRIVTGLRPSSGAIADCSGTKVSEAVQDAIETSWSSEPESRLQSADIAAVLQAELLLSKHV